MQSISPSLASTILARRVRSYNWRSVAVGDSLSALKWSPPKMVESDSGPLTMVFSGQGPQHINMGRDLYKQYAVFRDSINSSDAVYSSLTGESAIKDLGLFQGPLVEPVPKGGGLSKVKHTVVSIVMCQIALYDLYVSLGIVPDIVMGHSLGEIAMQYASGVLSKEGAIRLMAARAAAMTFSDGSGTMMALGCDEAAAKLFMSGIPQLWIAAINSPDAVTVAGSVESIAALEKRLAVQAPKLFARRLQVTNAYHTPLMNGSKEAFYKLVGEGNVFEGDSRHKGGMKVVSTVTGDFMSDGFGIDYCWDNVVEPVRFARAVQSVIRHYPKSMFLEIACHPVLSKSIEQCGASKSAIFCGMHRENPGETKYFLTSIGNMILGGLQCIRFGDMPSMSVSNLPSYPYQKKSYWFESAEHRDQRIGLPSTPLGAKTLKMSTQTHPWSSGHVVGGACLFPGSGYLEIAFQNGATTVYDSSFLRPLILSDKALHVEVDVEGLNLTVSTRDTIHYSSRISRSATEQFQIVDIDGLLERFTETLNGEMFYSDLSSLKNGFGYAAPFNSLASVRFNPNNEYEVIGFVSMPESLEVTGYLIHPAISDCASQVRFFAIFQSLAIFSPFSCYTVV
jgi:acyl transferase domain-containing protein